jgi:hypothetical protein
MSLVAINDAYLPKTLVWTEKGIYAPTTQHLSSAVVDKNYTLSEEGKEKNHLM